MIGIGLAACGDDGGGDECEPPAPLEAGDEGDADPLGAGPGEARAGRIRGDQLPASPGGLLRWRDGDFVLANDRVAIVIEDAGASDDYDPWGGRPVGIARVEDGALVAPADIAEIYLFVGRSFVVTRSVSVRRDGDAAVVRAIGRPAPFPLLDGILTGFWPDPYSDLEVAIDYVLPPDSDTVTIHLTYASPRGEDADVGAAMHGFAYVRRTPPMVPGVGFTEVIEGSRVVFVADGATSWAYDVAPDTVGSTIAAAGFVGSLGSELTIPACTTTTREHARLIVGDGTLGNLTGGTRTITGTVSDGSAPLAGAHVHATDGDAYLTRAVTDAAGGFTVVVPDGAVALTAFKRGWETATVDVAAGATTADLTVPAAGAIHVTATDGDGLAIPVRVQVLPVDIAIPELPASHGEPATVAGRLAVEFPPTGEVTIPAPAGTWRVVVSRGFEYELVDTEVVVAAGATVEVDAVLDRVVDTTGVMCGDFHIHTHRSLDSGDDAREKVRSAVADGVEIPVRSEHDVVDDFQPLIEELGLTAWALGIGSVEITSISRFGHFGVFPLTPDLDRQSGGTIAWSTWPDADDLDAPVAVRGALEVFAEIRARPEEPAFIINHPRQLAGDYFDYVGLDPATGSVERPEAWDEDFSLVEVFNDSDSAEARALHLADWYGLLNAGRAVFAVGSSDTHHIRTEPLGFPRTCIALGTDDPETLTPEMVRDGLLAGAATIAGGIYLDVAVGGAGPGETATGAGTTATADVRVQAASWVDVDRLDVIVDGELVTSIPITATDVTRFDSTVAVPVAAGGSWVVFAAFGDTAIEPVHPGRLPFAYSNPIWLTP